MVELGFRPRQSGSRHRHPCLDYPSSLNCLSCFGRRWLPDGDGRVSEHLKIHPVFLAVIIVLVQIPLLMYNPASQIKLVCILEDLFVRAGSIDRQII